MTAETFAAADLFCGAGGSSTGLTQACHEAGLRLQLVAVNHWDIAIDTHSTNHPDARHFCAKLDIIDPTALVPGNYLDLLLASTECTQHSRAKGDKPKSDQSRSQAWIVLHWVQAIYIEDLLLENVMEWLEWGPLGIDGYPLECGKGQLFTAFINSLRAAGFKHVEYRKLVAANYGDATTRERLFVQARRSQPCVWPEPTFPKQSWRSAREIIDWSIEAEDIATRTRPLVANTIARIEQGLRKYPGQPFLISYYGNGCALSLDDPLDTVTTKDRFALIIPNGDRIGYRLLQPRELASAMGFPQSYKFAGNKSDAVKQIGNAVCVNLSKVLCSAIINSRSRVAA